MEQMVDEGDLILVGKKTAARLLSISERSVDNLLARRELTAIRIGRRVLLRRRELERFARCDHKTQPTLKGEKGEEQGI